MKDHQPGCTVTENGICTCLNTGEIEILRRAKDKLDVRFIRLAAQHHRLVLLAWLLAFCFVMSAAFNVLFLFDIWIVKEK